MSSSVTKQTSPDALPGTFWIGALGGRSRRVPVFRVAEVRVHPGDPGVWLVYAERLDDGNRSGHRQGCVRKVAELEAFVAGWTQVSETRARELAR
jgi:hypothetical protein